MNILDKITAHKKKEVTERKSLFPEKLLEKSIYFPTQPISMKKYLLREDRNGIIAEYKRQSPSKGIINDHAKVEKTSIGYMQAGASALSVLTDTEFFGGKNEDLQTARKYNFCPILRKDFIIDEYQIIEAKSIGADCILLIAAILKPEEVKRLAAFAHKLGLEVLLEVHDGEELKAALCDEVDLVGVNNRDLKTFQVNTDTSVQLARAIPDQFVKVSESGISDPLSVLMLREHGYRGFLIGEHFMATSRPWETCRKFIQEVKSLEARRKGQLENAY
ncbi:indole-3-glycerol phosphate synthase TrpC [Roseivirga sp. BDSF3-8]|uniref:indole-3-glycerol phosphate synthase TrpC n=1 Tax=Roseivirga sp. BDSF3-8 TaxID=3241598 RepID=UPI0035327664